MRRSRGALGYFSNDLPASQTQGTTTRSYTLDAADRLGTWVDATGTGSTTTVNHYDDTSDSPAWTDTGTGTWTRQTTTPSGLLGIIATGTTGSATATSATVQLLNPHGDVYTTIPDTTAVTAASVGAANDTDEYGNTLTGGGLTYGWVGGHQRITDTTTGLIQMGVRLYNPTTGDLTSTDPIYLGNPTAYAYPRDPVSSADISGKSAGCVGPRGCGAPRPMGKHPWRFSVYSGFCIFVLVCYQLSHDGHGGFHGLHLAVGPGLSTGAKVSGGIGVTSMWDGEESNASTSVCGYYYVGGCVGGGHSYTIGKRGKKKSHGTYFAGSIGVGMGVSWSKMFTLF